MKWAETDGKMELQICSYFKSVWYYANNILALNNVYTALNRICETFQFVQVLELKKQIKK